MKLSVSTFPKGEPQKRQRLAEAEMPLNASRQCFEVETGEFLIPGETPFRVAALCTEPERYFAITVLQNGENIFNIAGSLENYANALLKLPSNHYLNIHIERDPVQQAA